MDTSASGLWIQIFFGGEGCYIVCISIFRGEMIQFHEAYVCVLGGWNSPTGLQLMCSWANWYISGVSASSEIRHRDIKKSGGGVAMALPPVSPLAILYSSLISGGAATFWNYEPQIFMWNPKNATCQLFNWAGRRHESFGNAKSTRSQDGGS